MRRPSRLLTQIRTGPLGSRSFRYIWLGETVSIAGTQFHLVALAWLTLDVSGSGAALASVLAIAAVLRAALLVLGGALTDRLSARHVMLLSNVARAALAGALAGAVVAGAVSMPLLYVVTALFGVADGIFLPAHAAVVPRLVSSDRLAAANSLVQGGRHAVTLMMPALAGALVASNGAAAAFAIDAGTFVIAAAALVRVSDHGARAGSSRAGLGGEIRAAFAYVGSHPPFGALLVAVAAINLAFAGPFVVGAATLGEERFGGAAALGWLLSSLAAGALGGTLLAGSLDRRRTPRGTLLIGMLLISAALVALAVAPQLHHACAAAALGGLAAGALNPLILSWLQRETPAALQGRVMALTMIGAVGLTPLSYAAAGLLVAFGTEVLFVTASAALAAVAVALSRALLDR